MLRNILILLFFCCSICLLGPASLLKCEEPADEKLQKLTDDSRSRAEAIEVSIAVGDRATKASVNANPIMKYTDVPRQIELATLWVWQEDGRPVALGKVEAYDRKEGTKWLYCFASASTGLVEGKWPDGHRFQAKKPGVEWVTIKGPDLHETAVGRSRQMKDIFQRFGATLRDDLLKTTDELRPLARPLHEYSSAKNGVLQGALYGFAANGTNPDVIVALEAVKADKKDAPKSWRYGVICMTATGVSVKLDKAEVFTRPYAKSPEDFETWTYFWENAIKK
jgi:hypothetical protein